MIRSITFGVIFIGTALIAWSLNVKYAYADLKAFLDVLLNVSGVVFTLMGIWIAFLYPNALARIVDPKKIAAADFTESREEYKRLTEVVGSVLKSALVVLGIMSLNAAKVVILACPGVVEHVSLAKDFALAVSFTLFAIQSDAVLGVIFANIMFLNDIHTKRAVKQVEEEY